MNLVADTIPVIGVLLNNLTASTIETIEKDLINAKQKFSEEGNEDHEFYHLVNLIRNGTELNLDTETKKTIADLIETKRLCNQHVLALTNNLGLLNIRCNTEYKTSEDALTAFFHILPEYFRTDHFLNEINKDKSSPLLSKDTIYAIQTKSYVADSEFVKKQREWFAPYEDSLNFFLGTQLLAEIF